MKKQSSAGQTKAFNEAAAAELIVARFNSLYPVGTAVVVHRDNGEKFETKITNSASIVGNTPVVWCEGVSGCYALYRVEVKLSGFVSCRRCRAENRVFEAKDYFTAPVCFKCGEQICLKCGCTDSCACLPNGCYWAEPGVCSECVEK